MPSKTPSAALVAWPPLTGWLDAASRISSNDPVGVDAPHHRTGSNEHIAARIHRNAVQDGRAELQIVIGFVSADGCVRRRTAIARVTANPVARDDVDHAVRAHAKHYVVVGIVEINAAIASTAMPVISPRAGIQRGLTVARELRVGPGESADYGLGSRESEAGQPKSAEEKIFRPQLVR